MTYVQFEFTYVQVLAVASVLLTEVVLKEKKTSYSSWNIFHIPPSAVSFTNLQPRLYGAKQLMVLHGSGGLAKKVQQHKTRCLKVYKSKQKSD